MNLESRLLQDKAKLCEEWFDLVLQSYPPETQKVWRHQKDQFANPVCHLTRESIDNLIDLALEWQDADAIAANLETIIKIRSVQSFTPAQTISFLFLLKKLIRDKYMKELDRENGLAQLLQFESKVDNMVMMALDIYSKTREKIFEMRVNEVKAAQHKLLMRANMIVECSAEEAE